MMQAALLTELALVSRETICSSQHSLPKPDMIKTKKKPNPTKTVQVFQTRKSAVTESGKYYLLPNAASSVSSFFLEDSPECFHYVLISKNLNNLLNFYLQKVT